MVELGRSLSTFGQSCPKLGETSAAFARKWPSSAERCTEAARTSVARDTVRSSCATCGFLQISPFVRSKFKDAWTCALRAEEEPKKAELRPTRWNKSTHTHMVKHGATWGM